MDELLPPWKVRTNGWFSHVWGYADTGEYFRKFTEFYVSLSQDGRKQYETRHPESPWWPTFFNYLVLVSEKKHFDARAYIDSIKEQQYLHADALLEEASSYEAAGSLEQARDIYLEVLQNVGDYSDVEQRSSNLSL